jgi:hypothetical protein
MGGTLLASLALAAVPVVAVAAEPPANVVAQAIRGIRVAEAPKGTSVLVVFVVDDAGDPVDEVAVGVRERGREVAIAKSDSRGRAVFRLSLAGPVSVRAAEEGFVPATASGVVLRRGGLTCVALPLEQAEPRP